eukprot:scaffold3501_cov113-Isochrysis_galbana.AAC.4
MAVAGAIHVPHPQPSAFPRRSPPPPPRPHPGRTLPPPQKATLLPSSVFSSGGLWPLRGLYSPHPPWIPSGAAEEAWTSLLMQLPVRLVSYVCGAREARAPQALR